MLAFLSSSVSSSYVEFVHDTVKLTDIPSAIPSQFQTNRSSSLLKTKDPNRKFVGKRVRQIGAVIHKRYTGMVRDTLDNDRVTVHIDATGKLENVPLMNLAFECVCSYDIYFLIASIMLYRRDDNTCTPLLCYKSGVYRRAFVPPPVIPGPTTSSFTLSPVPSTPLPPPSSEIMEPAWDPSSQPPKPCESTLLLYCCNI